MKKILLTIILIIFICLLKTDVAKAQTCPTLPTNTGTVTFSTTTTAGTYRVWSRMKSADANNNSFYLKIDNNCAVLVGNSSQISNSNWTWVDYQNGNTSTKIDATLTAGAHVITLIGNEPGVSVDKVLLTKNLSCIPIDFGANCPAELPISTPTPTPTLVPTAVPTAVPTPTPSPKPGDTLLTLRIGLDGIWNSGTHSNTNGSLSTKNPKHQSRTFAIDIIANNNNPVVQGKTTTLNYDSSKGYFAGTINLGGNFASGSYLVKVRTEGYLKRLLPGIQNITTGTTNVLLPRTNLVTGDISGDNFIGIQDYNILISCLNGPDVKTLSDSTGLCEVKYQALSDLDDNGVVDQIDLNLFLEEYSAQNGD